MFRGSTEKLGILSFQAAVVAGLFFVAYVCGEQVKWLIMTEICLQPQELGSSCEQASLSHSQE